MSASNPFIPAASHRVFVMVEGTFGTYVYPVDPGTATNQEIKVRSSNFETQMMRQTRSDARSTRSHRERITQKTTNTWEISSYLMGSGTAGTPPDIHPLLLGAIGGTSGYVNVGSTSDTYSLVASHTALPSLSMVRYADGNTGQGIFAEQLSGCYVNEMEISASGGESPTIRFAGGAKHHMHMGYSTLIAGITAESDVVVQTDDASNFEQYGVFAVGTDYGSDDEGYYIASKTANSLKAYHVATGAAATITKTIGTAVHPYVPAGGTSGSPISGNLGSTVLTASGLSAYGGGTVPVTSLSLSINNNIRPEDDRLFEQEISDFMPGFREVRGSLGVRLQRNLLLILGQRKQFTAHDLVVTFGNAAGNRCVLTMDCQLDFSAASFPEVSETDAGEVTVEVPILGIGDSNESELIVAFT